MSLWTEGCQSLVTQLMFLIEGPHPFSTLSLYLGSKSPLFPHVLARWVGSQRRGSPGARAEG